MAKGRLIAFRSDRLGARLISLVNAKRISETYDLPLAVHWPTTTGVGAEFNDPTELFDAQFVDRHFIDRQTWRELRPHAGRIRSVAPQGVDALRDMIASGQDVLFDMAFGLVCLKGEDPDEVARASGQVFHGLPFAPELAAQVELASRALDGAVAYHIRRGDLISDIKASNRAWPHKFVPEDYYRAHIRTTLERGATVVLFSDEAETLDRFRSEFPQARVPGDILNLEALTPAAGDFLELFAMSSCDKIIAPEQSAFSSTAAELGGIVKSDVKADLAVETRRSCSEDMVAKFYSNDGDFGGPGEVGQTLPHLLEHYREIDQPGKATDLYHEAARRKMPVSFLYPSAMELLLEADKPEAARDLSSAPREGLVYHTKDLVTCRVYEAAANARLGDMPAAARALLNAFWHNTEAIELRRIVPSLLMTGGLDDQSFLPFSRDVVGMAGRSAKAGNLSPLLLRLATDMTPVGATQPRRAALEVVAWDWAPLLGSNPVSRSLSKPLGQDLIKSLDSAVDDRSASPDILSTQALTLALRGRHGRAEKLLMRLLEDCPGHALATQRLSHVRWLRRDWAGAAEAAAQAADMSDAPAYQIWAGHCQLRFPERHDEALTRLSGAEAAQTGMPTVPALIADIERRRKNPGAALAAIERALELAPNNARFMLDRARLLCTTGADAQARAVLVDMREKSRMPMPGYTLLAELLRDAGELAAARDIVAEGLARNPEKPDLRELHATLQE